MLRRGVWLFGFALLGLAAGCNSSSTPIGGKTGASDGKDGKSPTAARAADGNEPIAPKGWKRPEVADGRWTGHPTVPYLPVLEEVDGVEIPRVAPNPGDYVAGGAVPADVGNPAAAGKAPEPVHGGSVTIRFNAQPKVLNPITESSAYQTYVLSYVQDALAWQNPETFEFEPYVAKKWLIEDSVKLRSDYSGSERRVAKEGGRPGATLELTVEKGDKDGPKPVVLLTTDAAGKPAGRTWVGFRSKAKGKQPLHFWSDEQGRLEAAAEPGDYTVVTGAELYGELKEEGDGYVLIRTAAPGATAAEPVKLSKEDVIDVQRDTVFTFDLRDDVTWSDGEPFTADDLVFAYRVINNPLVDGDSIRVYYEPVVAVEALGPHVVRMKYREQYFQAFEFTAGLAAFTPPLHLFKRLVKEKEKRELVLDRLTPEQEDAQGKWSVRGSRFAKFFNQADEYNDAPLGIGPYVVSSWSKQDKRLTLERRKDYWNKAKGGYLDRIVVKFIEDNPTAMQALRAGEIDFFWMPTPEQYFEELAGPPDWFKRNYVKAAWYTPGFSYVGWNLRRPMFEDRRVRLALAMLFDKEEFLAKKMHNAGVIVSGSQFFFGPGYDHSVKSVAYDPQTAQDLLAEAGWIDTNGDGLLDKGGKPFRFELLMPPGNPTATAMVELMQRNFKQAGIRMDVRLIEWASFLEKILGRQFDVVTLSWASSRESDPFQIWHGSQAGEDMRSSNHVGFRNATADELIERIRVTLDDEERSRLFYSFHRLLDAEQPYMFLWNRQDLGLYDRKFRGVKWYAVRPGFDLREWYIPKELQ